MNKTNYEEYTKELLFNIKQKKKESTFKFRNLFSDFSYTRTKKEIESYGFNISWRDIIINFMYLLIPTILISFTSRLNLTYIGCIIFLVFLFFPLLLKAKYKQLYHLERFEMVVSYIENIIPIFESKPVIVYALSEVVDLLEGKIKECVEMAIDCILDNTDEVNVYDVAFHYIESEFPNSRIFATHHMMKTVETMNSKNFESMVMNLFLDVQAWISRVYGFQKELQNRKNKLLFLTILTMASSSFFVGVFTNNEVFTTFVSMPLFQLCTFIFIVACIMLFFLFYISMSGKWMVDDRTIKNEEHYIIAFQKSVLKTQERISVFQWCMIMFFFCIGIISAIFFNNMFLLFICLFLCIYVYTANKRSHKKYHKKVKKALEIEFPIWLRDVCLNLQNFTVINAIEKSIYTSSILMQFYIERFLHKVKDNPVSMNPYSEFLKEYDIPDVKADLKVLYALSMHGEKQIEKEVNALIIRNQEMIAKSERIKNEDHISIIGRLGFVPVILFIMNMFANMSLLFLYLIEFMNNAVHL